MQILRGNHDEDNRKKGRLFVIEGLDGSGKATQAQLLYDNLNKEGTAARKVSFPNYESDSSALVRMYLRGDFGTDPSDVNAYAASSFYAADRYAGFKSDWGGFYESGGVIIADRYTTSNAVHQCSKLPKEEWDSYLDWLFHYEYVLMGIPAPDAVIYLEVDPEVSQKLMNGRYHGDASKKDIHERNVEYLKRSAEAAAYCSSKLGWHVVKCSEKGQMRSVDAIQAQIRDILALFQT